MEDVARYYIEELIDSWSKLKHELLINLREIAKTGRFHELQIEEEAMPCLMELNMKNHGPAKKLTMPDRLLAFVTN